jgi:hypothetical protein
MFYLSLIISAFVFSFVTITALVSAQTSNPQQPPNFGDFNGTMPSPPGGFMGNGTFPGGPGGQGFGGGNFTMPRFSGTPPANMNGQTSQVSASSQTNYTVIIAGVLIAVAIGIGVAVLVLSRKKKAKKEEQPKTETVTDNPQSDDSQDFDVDSDFLDSPT